MKKSKNKGTQNEFKQFEDEQTHQQAAQIQRNWRKKIKQQRNKIAIRILIAAIVVVGLVFAIAFNVFISRKNQHVILDSQDGYTYVQTNFPQLKVLVDDQVQTYETKMVKGVGMVFGELVAWAEGNVVSNWKILFVPNERSGTAMLAVALGYGLNNFQGGKLDILALIKSQRYQKMILKNVELIKKEISNGLPVNIINVNEDIGDAYDLVVVENNDFFKTYSWDRFKRLVEVHRTKWDSHAVGGYVTHQFNHEIARGKVSDEIRGMGEFYGYSLVPLMPSDKDQYKTVIFQRTKDPTINLCPEAQQPFKAATELRNLIEFMRNKNMVNSGLYYGLDSVEVLQALTNFNVSQIYSDNVSSEFNGKVLKVGSISQVPASKDNYYILKASSAANIAAIPLGTTLIYVKTQNEFSDILKKFSQSASILQLPPINSNGCFYPPRPFEAGKSGFTRPSFLIVGLSQQP